MNLNRLSFEYQRFQERKCGDAEGFFSLIKKGTPLEYINQASYFYKSEFYVDERVLIPRSETELLVERAVAIINEHPEKELSLCEVGVGSGVISLSCLMDIHQKKLNVIGTDISPEAIQVFENNVFLNAFKISPIHSLQTLVTDRLKGVKGPFDLILSNPPYIMREKDENLVHNQVLKFEPHVALFLKDSDYFSWFDEFFRMVNDCLNSRGTFLMEGHESHLTDLKALLDKQGWGKSTVLKDLAGTFRFLEVIKNT